MRFRRTRPRAERLSEILARLAEPATGSVTLGDVLSAVGERSFGALLVILAIPNMVAGLIPGLSILLGLPLLLVSVQLLVGAEKPWLPRRLARLEIKRADLRRIVERTRKTLRRLERALRPRLEFITASWAERLIGLGCVALSILVFLPIPFANLVPATGILLFGFAMLERDGLMALVAFGIVGLSAALFSGVAFAFIAAAGHTVRQLGLSGG
jgi:hypothetical protein